MNAFSFQNLYLEQLNELYNSEMQIAESLPNWMAVISSADLRDTVGNYLQEVKHHIDNLNKMFTDMKLSPNMEKSHAIAGIFELGNMDSQHGGNSAVKDAALICVIQRLMHYKMALYGTARTFARHLDYNKSMDMLQRALNEEGEADRKLTRLAEGGVFTTGINEQACTAKMYAQ